MSDMHLPEILDLIEYDFGGWTWLLRSNDDSRGRYFANLIAPDFVAIVAHTEGGFVDESLGSRFIAYGDTRESVLKNVFEQASAFKYGNIDHAD